MLCVSQWDRLEGNTQSAKLSISKTSRIPLASTPKYPAVELSVSDKCAEAVSFFLYCAIELLSKAHSSELLLNTLRPPLFRCNVVVARGKTKQAGPQEVALNFRNSGEVPAMRAKRRPAPRVKFLLTLDSENA